MATGPEPLRLALRSALEEKGLSVRGASKRLHAFDDRQSEASWKRTLNKGLDEADDYVYTPETAAVLERFFEKPSGHFVRPQRRESELDRLEAENARLRRLLEERTAGTSGAGRD